MLQKEEGYVWSFEGCRRSAVESGVRSGRTSLPAEGCGELHGGLSSLRPRITSALGSWRWGRMEKDPGVGERGGRRPAGLLSAGGTRDGILRKLKNFEYIYHDFE